MLENKNPAKNTRDFKKLIEDAKEKKNTLQNDDNYEVQFFDIGEVNNRIVNLFEDNIEEDRKLRKLYAKILIGILIIELVILNIIFICVGTGALTYSESVLNIFITGGIAEIFLLIKMIVEYLFKDHLTDALKIILEKNNTK